jgi:uncharacterized protein YcbX
MPRVAEIYRYPVKGLSAEPMRRVAVGVGEVIPFDRAYALENGPSTFDPASPKWTTKNAFLMLMRHERLAELQTSFDTETRTLTIRKDDVVLVAACLETDEGRRAIEAFFTEFSAADLKGPVKLLHVPGFSFQDTSTGMVISVINLASIRQLSDKLGTFVEPLRFRANLYVEGLAPWEEFTWLGHAVTIGSMRLVATKRIDRCAAVNVDPFTGARDLNLPRSLMQLYDNIDCGIYLKVIGKGEFGVGDEIAVGETVPLPPHPPTSPTTTPAPSATAAPSHP